MRRLLLLLATSIICVCVQAAPLVMDSNEDAYDQDLICNYMKAGTDSAAATLNQIGSNLYILSNSFVCGVFDLSLPGIVTLRGDYLGQRTFGSNVLSGPGISLGGAPTQHTTVTILANTSEIVSISVRNLVDDASSSTVSEDWTLSLERNARFMSLDIQGKTVSDVAKSAAKRQYCFVPTSLYALFNNGVVQMKAADNKQFYPSNDVLPRLYALGGSNEDLKMRGNASISVVRGGDIGSHQVVLRSTDNGQPCWSGFDEILTLPTKQTAVLDNWDSDPFGGYNSEQQQVEQHEWHIVNALYPNDRDFPTMGLTSSPNLPAEDMQGFMTGIWASIVGNLNTHDNEVAQGHRVGQIATTIHFPGTGYSGTYNYFDPDNYIGTAALLLSGDAYLQEQVRLCLERTGSFINSKGQIPHHFVGIEPVYQALSGETQTGPNVFWILSCFNYAKSTGNLPWLISYMPTLRNASRFLFDMIDADFGLIKAPGSLMIDVFIRNNFTADSNAMVVGFLNEFAEGEKAVGNHTGASHLLSIANSIAKAMNDKLWNAETDDHYVTQLNPDGSTTDFVDYDANLIAIAHGVADMDRSLKILQRIDGGRCAHGRPTFVSEVYYGPHDTTSGNIGDSWCAMGRIGWFDALARQRLEDVKTFESKLYFPLRDDLLRWTWLHERYACDGSPQQNRTQMYFEYPAVVSMFTRTIRYGIQLGLNTLSIAPMGVSEFSFHVGNVHVDYSPDYIKYSIPGTRSLQATMTGLNPNSNYVVEADGVCSDVEIPVLLTSDHQGHIVYDTPVGEDCIVSITLEK